VNSEEIIRYENEVVVLKIVKGNGKRRYAGCYNGTGGVVERFWEIQVDADEVEKVGDLAR